MENEEIRKTVAETGRILLEKKLVARTWGNISMRVDATHFAITPSGLGYENMQAEDIPIFDTETESYEGTRKPSSEKRIHAAAYLLYPEVNFVIHTHQDYATAVGLAEDFRIVLTKEEKDILGEVKIADYGLSGTKKLKENVAKAMEGGCHTVLMKHHGAVILGLDREDAINRAEMLENICRREVESRSAKINLNAGVKAAGVEETADFLSKIKETYPNAILNGEPVMLYLASKGGFNTQLDDMAQMIGGKLPGVEPDAEAALKILKKQDAVLIKGMGLIIKADKDEDVETLSILLNKAAISKIYTMSLEKEISLGGFDCKLQRTVFKKKYSKKKES